MLEITIDATPIQPQSSGVGFYVTNLVHALAQLQEPENFQLSLAYQPRLKNWLRWDFSLPDAIAPYPRTNILPIPVRISNLLLAAPDRKLVTAYFDYYLRSPTIFHGTNFALFPGKNSRKLITIYDLTFIKYPHYADAVMKTYTQKIKQCLQEADAAIAISENTKKEIVAHFNFDPDRIYVTPLASRYHPKYLSEEQVDKIQSSLAYNFARPYILFVSTIEPRKNIINLVHAFNYLKEQYKIPHNLVLIGQKGWNYQDIFNAIASSPWREQIHHLDYLSDELVALFYSQANAFVYPSYYEGFGLPVLEAMTLGTPVITSNTSSLPEVVGDAAILIDPDDAIALAEAILKVISDSQLRQELIQKGQQRAKLFSWENTARETLKAYQSLLR